MNDEATESDGRPTREQRWRHISALLARQPVVQISALAAQFNVSVETVRRDIDTMAEAGLVTRTYGGASAPQTAHEPGMAQRARLRVAERQRIARHAAAQVRDDDVLMIDASATCVHLARRLVEVRRRLLVITNSFAVASTLAYNPGFEVFIAPGRYDGEEGASYGVACAEFIQRYRADHCFSSCAALCAEGPTEVDGDVAGVKRAMIERSRATTLLVDHDKFVPAKLERVCALARIDRVVCDLPPPATLAEALDAAQVSVEVAA